MTVIQVTVESSFTGNGSGFQQIAIDDRLAVQELIRQYCSSKGIAVNPTYAIINKSNMVLHANRPLSYYEIKDNESLVLGTAADESRTYRFGHWFTLAGLGFLFGLIGITICIILFAVIRTVPENYAIVVDAGSTHSDVILYKWPGMKVNNTGEVVQVSTCYVTGGIAQVTSTNVSSYFDDCFSQAGNQIPVESQANAEVLLGATAGMRLLNSSDSQKANETLTSIRKYLNTTDLVVKESNVNIISGSTEGISGWITINFLKDTIYSEVGYLNNSWGALDLGGASTQITFEVSEDMKNSSFVTTLHLFGHVFRVFSKSFLCYGVVQARTRYRAILLDIHIKAKRNNLTVESPCDPRDSIIKVNADDFQTPCLMSLNANAIDTWLAKPYLFHGTGNYEDCKIQVDNLLNSTYCHKYGWNHCMDPTTIPSYASERKFMGFASYSYVANALQLNETTTIKDFIDKTKKLCNTEYVKILEMKSGPNKNVFKDLENSCFKANFVYKLLHDIYGFNTDAKWSNLMFTTKVNGATLGWSLGYMINATEAISAGKSIPTLKSVPFALLLVLFAMFLIISLGFVFHGIKLRKSASYQRKITRNMDEELIKFIAPNFDSKGLQQK